MLQSERFIQNPLSRNGSADERPGLTWQPYCERHFRKVGYLKSTRHLTAMPTRWLSAKRSYKTPLPGLWMTLTPGLTSVYTVYVSPHPTSETWGGNSWLHSLVCIPPSPYHTAPFRSCLRRDAALIPLSRRNVYLIEPGERETSAAILVISFALRRAQCTMRVSLLAESPSSTVLHV